MAFKLIRMGSTRVLCGDLVIGKDGKVTVVSNTDNFHVRDVVLPMPGYNIVYPENELGEMTNNPWNPRMLCLKGTRR